jgi:acetyltransferase-like isoleucine patch superfamily enzyme
MIEGSELRRIPWRIRYRFLAQAGSDIRRILTKLTHLHADVIFEHPVYLGPGFVLRMRDRGALRLGSGVELRRDFVCEVVGSGKVTIGARCAFAGMTMIQCTTTVDIGEDAIFAHGVLIVDGNHRFRDHELNVQEQGYDYRPIRIGRGALVHTNCTVISDVGERAVIGANSVVTRPIPAYCLAVGSPAQVVDYFGPPERRTEILGAAESGVGRRL